MRFSVSSVSALLLLLLLAMPIGNAFVVPLISRTSTSGRPVLALFSTKQESDTSTASTDAFSAFADSLNDEPTDVQQPNGNQDAKDDDDEHASWQASLEHLLDPSTSLAQRQILLSDLLSANEEIRQSVLAALRDRKIDPLLTPTGKKLQDGTRAVARQITTDILPGIAQASSQRPPADLPELIPKVGARIFNAIASQAKRNLELLRGDLQDPSRIPQRLEQQFQSVTEEARNVFAETPEGLVGPPYTVVSRGEGYEIRDYPAYTVASTNMAKVGEPYSMDDLASGGAAFNTLAAYLFGANDEGKTMAMTTPVTTTSLGEMRFYLTGSPGNDDFPQPLEKDDAASFYEKGEITITEIPPARLAVARFTGFVTEGEVSRQKDALLTRLELDGIEIDVPHGAVVPHVVFQYNPPYTIPVVRRNEIAVPVVKDTDANLETEWLAENNNMNGEESDSDRAGAPSDGA